MEEAKKSFENLMNYDERQAMRKEWFKWQK
jgi:hypothetical protein